MPRTCYVRTMRIYDPQVTNSDPALGSRTDSHRPCVDSLSRWYLQTIHTVPMANTIALTMRNWEDRESRLGQTTSKVGVDPRSMLCTGKPSTMQNIIGSSPDAHVFAMAASHVQLVLRSAHIGMVQMGV